MSMGICHGLRSSFIMLSLVPSLIAMTTGQSTSSTTNNLTTLSTASSLSSSSASTSFLDQTIFAPTSLTLSSTTSTIIHLNTPDPFEETVTLKAADQTQANVPIIYLLSVPRDYIAKDSPVLQLFKDNPEQLAIAAQELVDKLNDNKYLKTKNQLNAFVAALELTYNKQKHITNRTLAIVLASYLLVDEGLLPNDLIALWKAAQFIDIKPISAACARAIIVSNATLDLTTLPKPLRQHLDLEKKCQTDKDTTEVFCRLNECCLLDGIYSETKPSLDDVWNAWQTNPDEKDLLNQLPQSLQQSQLFYWHVMKRFPDADSSQQQSELIYQYFKAHFSYIISELIYWHIITHFADTNFDLSYWYGKLPKLNTLVPRNKILTELHRQASILVRKKGYFWAYKFSLLKPPE